MDWPPAMEVGYLHDQLTDAINDIQTILLKNGVKNEPTAFLLMQPPVGSGERDAMGRVRLEVCSDAH